MRAQVGLSISAQQTRTPKEELPAEPVWYLRSLAYSAYRQTRHWTRRSRAFRDAADSICVLCGLSEEISGDWLRFHVHHLTYEHLGYEKDSDLVLLCAPCHHLVHYPDSLQAQHWLEVRAFEAPDLYERAAAMRPEAL